jgi:hypothetical protein
MERKGIQWRGVFRREAAVGDLLCFGDQRKRRGGKRWHVQRLANVARCVVAASVMV